MEQTDYAYSAGYLIGGPLLVLLVGYILVRIIKKRNPSKKEWVIIAVVAVVLGIISIAAKTGKSTVY